MPVRPESMRRRKLTPPAQSAATFTKGRFRSQLRRPFFFGRRASAKASALANSGARAGASPCRHPVFAPHTTSARCHAKHRERRWAPAKAGALAKPGARSPSGWHPGFAPHTTSPRGHTKHRERRELAGRETAGHAPRVRQSTGAAGARLPPMPLFSYNLYLDYVTRALVRRPNTTANSPRTRGGRHGNRHLQRLR